MINGRCRAITIPNGPEIQPSQRIKKLFVDITRIRFGTRKETGCRQMIDDSDHLLLTNLGAHVNWIYVTRSQFSQHQR